MGFKWILIGLIFLLPIYFSTYDILPDFLGYAFIIYGLYIIRRFNVKFRIALIPAVLLLLVSFMLFIDSILSIFEMNFSLITLLFIENIGSYFTIFFLIKDYSILYLIFALLLYYGISENAAKFGCNGLAERSKNLCFLILFYTLITSIPIIMVLPPIIYHILIYIITIFEFFVVIDARQALE